MNEGHKELLRRVQELFQASERRMAASYDRIEQSIDNCRLAMGGTVTSSSTSAWSDVCCVSEVPAPASSSPDTNLIVATDVEDPASPTPARCSMEVPSRDSTELRSASAPATAPATPTDTVDIIPVLAAAAASDGTLDGEAIGGVADMPATCSMVCLPRHLLAAQVLVAPLPPAPTEYILDTNSVHVAVVPLAVPDVFPAVSAPAAPTVQLQQLYNDNGDETRPLPWPSFKCHSRAADTTKPLPWLSYMWRIGPVQKDSCQQSEIKALVSNMSMVCGNRSSSHGYISGNILLSPSGIWCLGDLFLSPMSCWPDIQYVQQTNAVLEAPLCPERHNIRVCRRGVAPSFLLADLLEEKLNGNPKYSLTITSSESGYKLLNKSLVIWRTSAVCILFCCSARFQWKVAWLFYHLSNCCPVTQLRLLVSTNYFTLMYAVHNDQSYRKLHHSNYCQEVIQEASNQLNCRWRVHSSLGITLVQITTNQTGASCCLGETFNHAEQFSCCFRGSDQERFPYAGTTVDQATRWCFVELKYWSSWFMPFTDLEMCLIQSVTAHVDIQMVKNTSKLLESVELCSADGRFDAALRISINHVIAGLQESYLAVWGEGAALLAWKIIGLSAEHQTEATHSGVGSLYLASRQWIIPWLDDIIVFTATCSPLDENQIPYSCAKFITTHLFGSDGTTCLNALLNILHGTDDQLATIMLDWIESRLAGYGNEIVVYGKEIVLCNILMPGTFDILVSHFCCEGVRLVYWGQGFLGALEKLEDLSCNLLLFSPSAIIIVQGHWYLGLIHNIWIPPCLNWQRCLHAHWWVVQAQQATSQGTNKKSSTRYWYRQTSIEPQHQFIDDKVLRHGVQVTVRPICIAFFWASSKKGWTTPLGCSEPCQWSSMLLVCASWTWLVACGMAGVELSIHREHPLFQGGRSVTLLATLVDHNDYLDDDSSFNFIHDHLNHGHYRDDYHGNSDMIKDLQGPWDPGEFFAATAWGQADFQGGRGVSDLP